MNLTDLPEYIILKIIDIPWEKNMNKQIKKEYKHKNTYNSLIKVNKSFYKRLSSPDILIPVMASYSARQFNKEQLIYIGKQLNVSLNQSYTSFDMRKLIYYKIKEENLNDKGNNSIRRKGEGIRVNWFLRKDRRYQNNINQKDSERFIP